MAPVDVRAFARDLLYGQPNASEKTHLLLRWRSLPVETQDEVAGEMARLTMVEAGIPPEIAAAAASRLKSHGRQQ